jgi:hypothetical protein
MLVALAEFHNAGVAAVVRVQKPAIPRKFGNMRVKTALSNSEDGYHRQKDIGQNDIWDQQ